jgi:quercetin dioxygenase-like cupin family protein
VSHNRFHVIQDAPHRWRNIEELVYKDEDGNATFKDVTRRVLFGEDHLDGMEVRYFEVDAGGHTTLEKHEHTHLVIPIKGKGACLVGDPPWAWHQYRADDNEVFGFLCLVKLERDRPTLPTPEEIAEMKMNPEVAAFIRHQ